MEAYYLNLSPHWWQLEPNERRTLRQTDLIKQWKGNNGRGFILAVTGFGKTRVGERIIAEAFERNPDRVVNIIVPHKAAYAVWEGVKERSENKRIRICMAHTYLRRSEKYRKCDLLVIDECHRFTNEKADLFGKIIDKTSRKFVLALSATLNEEHQAFLVTRGVPKVGQVNMKEARECNYVAEHYNWIVDMKVSGRDLNDLDKLNREFHKTWGLFNHDLREILNAMSGGPVGSNTRERYADLLQVDSNIIYGLARRAHTAMNERKVFLQKAPSKIDMVMDIIEKFPGRNILTFGEFTGFADELTERMGDRARSFHTKIQSKLATVTKTKRWKTARPVDRFMYTNEGKLVGLKRGIDLTADKPHFVTWEIEKPVGAATLKKMYAADFEDPNSPVNILNTAKSLDEAADIDKVDVAILVSYSSTARQTIQRIGRAIRFKDGKIAHIFILCLTRAEGRTQEEKWLKEALEELDEYTHVKPYHVKAMQYD